MSGPAAAAGASGSPAAEAGAAAAPPAPTPAAATPRDRGASMTAASESAVAGGELVPALFPGEVLVCSDPDVTYLDPIDGPVPGALYVTNFKVFFHSGEDRSPSVEVALGLVDHVEKIGGQSSRGENSYGLEIFCKDIRSVRFAHRQEGHSRRIVYDAIMAYAFPLSSGKEFFATQYQGLLGSSESLPGTNGWSVYNFEREMARLGVPNTSWRISDFNQDYAASPTYPLKVAVPAGVTDEDLARVAQFRSRGRIPALSWVHPTNLASITRCSQPRVGFTGKRCSEDEAMIQAILDVNPTNNDLLYIMDARPRRNAVANQAKGLGYEYDSVYSNTELVFLNIHNIHVMRESLRKVRDMCFPTVDDTNWLSQLDGTSWLKHIKCVLAGAVRIVELVDRGHSVLIHCSDGWDRTAQLSALAMIMLDPFYRTISGFEVLVEKEWLSFGHKFAQRLGHGDKNHGDDQRSPIFLQFMDCTWQIMQMFPCAFEFNEHFLITILDHMYSCLFGTFLYNCESERVKADVRNKTRSLWDFVNQHSSDYTNPLYAPSYQPEILAAVPSMRHLSLWTAYYLRWNTRMRPQETLFDRSAQIRAMVVKLQKECDELRQAAKAAKEGSAS